MADGDGVHMSARCIDSAVYHVMRLPSLACGVFQSPDGSIIMSHRGALPRGADTPGTIRYFDDGKVTRTEVLKVPNAEACTPANNEYTDVTKAPRPCELGLNL